MNLGEGVSGPEAKKSQKSLEKVYQGRVPKVRKKSRKRSEKSKKSENGFLETFRTFFETFFRLSQPPAREAFSRLCGFGLRDSFSQVHGTSTHSKQKRRNVSKKTSAVSNQDASFVHFFPESEAQTMLN